MMYQLVITTLQSKETIYSTCWPSPTICTEKEVEEVEEEKPPEPQGPPEPEPGSEDWEYADHAIEKVCSRARLLFWKPD